MKRRNSDTPSLAMIESRERMREEDLEQVSAILVGVFIRRFFKKDQNEVVKVDKKNGDVMKCHNSCSALPT